MLTLLHIENIAVIERCDLEFQHGFHVLTGETGAGKSIIIDAINMILGERTSHDLIRTGAGKALVSAMFDLSDSDAAEWLSDSGYLDEDDPKTLLIQREITVDGRNTCKINGRPATVSSLKELSVKLVNIHGQHGSQQLLNRECHSLFLDRFTEDPEGIYDAYRSAFDELLQLRAEENSIVTDEDEKARRIEYLEYQIRELEEADLKPGEEEELTERRRILRNATKLMDSLSQVLSLLSGDDDLAGICASLQQAEHILSRISDFAPELEAWASKLASATDVLSELTDEIRFFTENYDCSPEEIARVESRCDLLSKLKGKYGNSVEDMVSYLEQARKELSDITLSSERAEQLHALRTACEKRAYVLAEKLFAQREAAARDLETKIAGELADLDMGKVQFSIVLAKRDSLNRRGIDDVEFLISTNPGEPLKSLNKIASGGELSRIMLAILNVFAAKDHVPTLIFDEVDTGISGRAAQRVAEKLWHLATCKQVICVTHLAQLAAMADVHYQIEKTVQNDRTYTKVFELDESGRVDELARITGGSNITDMTRSNASELLRGAEILKKEITNR